MSSKDILKIALGIGLLLGLITLYVSELFYLGHTTGLMSVAVYVAVAVAAMAVFGLLFAYGNASLYDKMMMVMASMVITALIIPPLVSAANRLADCDASYVSFRLVDYQKRSPQPMGVLDLFAPVEVRHVLTVVDDEGREGVYSLPEGGDFVIRSGTVDLLLCKGTFGLHYPALHEIK